MISKEDKLYITSYYDVYGRLLPDRTLRIIKMYYDLDMSLAEIAGEFDVSRQAVRDTIIRAEEQLKEFDRSLGLITLLDNINVKCNELNSIAIELDDSRISDIAKSIVGSISMNEE